MCSQIKEMRIGFNLFVVSRERPQRVSNKELCENRWNGNSLGFPKSTVQRALL